MRENKVGSAENQSAGKTRPHDAVNELLNGVYCIFENREPVRSRNHASLTSGHNKPALGGDP